MREYIEKDKLLNDIECIDISDCTDIDDIFTEIEKTIDEQPTADVVEVRHGHWFLLDECANEGVYCSVCGKKVYRVNYANQKLKSKFCPNCGARMDGETE